LKGSKTDADLSMLTNFFEANRSLFKTLAETWLNSDAMQFSVWSGSRQLAAWPPSAHHDEAYIYEDIMVKGIKLGELRLAGQLDAAAARRLHMDAAFLSSMAAQESDISAMASELIDTRDQLVALYNLSQNTGTSLDLDQSLEYLASEAHHLTQSTGAFVTIQYKNAPTHIAYSPNQRIEEHRILQYFDELKANEHGFLFVDGKDHPGEEENLLILSFRVRGATAAAIGIHTNVSRAALSPMIKLLRTIAEYTGTHIQNLIMMRESMELAKLHIEMDLARNVQSSLLPTHTPLVTGLDIWAESRPASVVGGDFYDFIDKSGKPMIFTVGDISGKGMPASMPMAMTRALIRAQANAYQLPTPQTILRSSNAALYDDFNQLGVFATVFIGQYNHSGNELLFANAGHSPVIYCPSHGGARLIQASDIPVGMLPGTPYENHLLHLAPDDVLVVGTDGLYEVSNGQDQLLGYECLIEQVVSLARGTAKEIAEGLLSSVANYRGNQAQEDDQTLIVFKRTNP
jgi:sigma-B regulation protein RsbU (phosphoserine phosphatase)